jgi:hypothetical protein
MGKVVYHVGYDGRHWVEGFVTSVLYYGEFVFLGHPRLVQCSGGANKACTVPYGHAGGLRVVLSVRVVPEGRMM